jgi:UDP-2,3-diacylglucosamine hydrolase
MKDFFPQLHESQWNEPATYFISDLHLSDQTPAINESFYTFLAKVAPTADAIYILGDFLDAWVGDDSPAQFFHQLAEACQQASKQTSLYFLRGNRDFLFSDQLLKQCGIHRLKDPSTIELYNKRVAVCHGDHLCGKDISHLFLRCISQSRFFCALFLSFPLSVRLKIAGQLRGESTRRVLYEPLIKFNVTEHRVLKTLKRSKTDTLIHGHTHKPHHHTHSLGNRFVMGCWGETAIILRYNREHHATLLQWDPHFYF